MTFVNFWPLMSAKRTTSLELGKGGGVSRAQKKVFFAEEDYCQVPPSEDVGRDVLNLAIDKVKER